MSQNTGIQWTDATWNPVVGCEHVSPGCDNCYAKQLHDMRHKARLAGKRVLPLYDQPFEKVQLRQHKVDEPLRWRKPRRVFVNSMSDLFHKDVPEWFLDDVWRTMAATPQHTYQILTKRPHRMRRYVNGLRHVLPNVWLGTSTESQATLDQRLPFLMDTAAAVRFLSMEPLLELVEIDPDDIGSRDAEGRYLDWVIVGGESGPKARGFDIQWAREIIAECGFAGVPVFVKQLGSRPFSSKHEIHLKDSKGGDMDEWPSDLCVREFPDSRRPLSELSHGGER